MNFIEWIGTLLNRNHDNYTKLYTMYGKVL